MSKNVARITARASVPRPQRRCLSHSLPRHSTPDDTPTAITSDDPPISPADRKAALHTTIRAQDQAQLRKARAVIANFVAQTLAAKTFMTSLPTSVKVLPDLPPYKIGSVIREASLVSAAAEATKAQAEVLVEHLKDLQREPYGEEAGSDFAKFIERTATMTRAEKEQEVVNLGRLREGKRLKFKEVVGLIEGQVVRRGGQLVRPKEGGQAAEALAVVDVELEREEEEEAEDIGWGQRRRMRETTQEKKEEAKKGEAKKEQDAGPSSLSSVQAALFDKFQQGER